MDTPSQTNQPLSSPQSPQTQSAPVASTTAPTTPTLAASQTTPTTPQTPQTTPLPTFGKKLDLDPRTMETMKASAIWNAVSQAISTVFGHLSLFFIGGALGQFLGQMGTAIRDFPITELIMNAFWGAIWGAVIGFGISKYFAHIQQLNRAYLQSRLNTFFKLMFYPSLVLSLFFFMMTSVVSFVIGFMPLIVSGIGIILSSFVYAKMMAKKVGQLYPPPV